MANATRLRLLPTIIVGAMIAAATFVYCTETNVPSRKDGTIVRAEIHLPNGTIAHVVHTTNSSVHGQRTHADGDYTVTYGGDVYVANNEIVRTVVTAAVSVDMDNNRTLECIIRENGMAVRRNRLFVRRGYKPFEPITCSRVTHGK